MGWPTPQDYNEAVQNPQHNFGDPELQRGEIEVSAMGLPRVASGAFASVYRMRCGDKDYAIRCFLHPVSDQEKRYEAISQFVLADNLDCTVKFEYVVRGIRIHSAWYPILKMEWVPGQALELYVKDHLNDSAALITLANNLQRMLRQMNQAGIAHGDLQHGNIIVLEGGEIRLVDYDGMYVPSLSGLDCPELGHRNYQHPGRTRQHYGPYLDNFAAWSIYISIICLSRDNSLFDQLKGGDECLLFRLFDYRNPVRSRVFATLDRHASPEIVHLSRILRTLILTPIETIPLLGSKIEVADFLSEQSSNLPDWMITGEIESDDIDFRDNHDDIKPNMVAASSREFWPTLSQYASAINTPEFSFTDEALRACRAVRIRGKLWSVATTENAIFRLRKPQAEDQGAYIAVKVFLQFDESRHQRYEEVSIFLNSLGNSASKIYEFMPGSQYLPHGIRIDKGSYPILIMEWQEGPTVEKLLTGAQSAPAQLASAKRQFRSLCSSMANLGIIHGQLETTNLLLSPGGLRIIDFDSLQLEGTNSSHAAESRGSLRHPLEPPRVDEYSDRYPSWVIDSAITLVEFEPQLAAYMPKILSEPWLRCKSSAPLQPTNSLLCALERSPHLVLQQRAQLLKCFLEMGRAQIPPLVPEAAISEQFAHEQNLQFGIVPGQPSNVSPDLLLRSDDALPTWYRGDPMDLLPGIDTAEPEVNLDLAPPTLSKPVAFLSKLRPMYILQAIKDLLNSPPKE